MNKSNIRSWRGLFVAAAVLAAGWSMSARAAPAVESISGSVQGGSEVVRIDFSEPLTSVPSGFAIQAPARIALDVPGATNGLGRNAVELNVGNLRSVNVVQTSDRARLVLNLKAAANYQTKVEGKSLLVTLEPVGASSSPVAQTFAESRNRDAQPIKDMDFRRGPDGSGRVIVDLPSNQVGVDIRA